MHKYIIPPNLEKGFKMKRILIAVNVLVLLFLLSGSLHAQAQTIQVTNKTGMALSSVYISPAGQDTWHLIRSTRNGIFKDETFSFRQSVDKVYCSYDFKFRCDDGNYYYMNNVDLCTNSGFSLIIPANTR
jgi:hypothetical protein